MTVTAAGRWANASSIRMIVKSLTGRGRASRENQPISVISLLSAIRGVPVWAGQKDEVVHIDGRLPVDAGEAHLTELQSHLFARLATRSFLHRLTCFTATSR